MSKPDKHLVYLSKFKKKYQYNKLFEIINNEYFKKVFNNLMKLTFVKKESKITDDSYIIELSSKFDLLTDYIQKNSVLQIVNIFIEKLYRYMNTSIENESEIIAPQLVNKELLISFCIAGYPDFMLKLSSKEINNLEGCLKKDIFDLSKKLLITLGCLINVKTNKDELLRKFIKALNMYSNCLLLFMNEDKQENTCELVNKWYCLEKSIVEIRNSDYTNYEKKEFIDYYLDSQKNIVILLKHINIDFDETYLYWFKSTADKIEDNIHKCFWDTLSADINSNKYDIFENLLNELKIELLCLNNNNNNKTVMEDLEKYLDVDFIKQMATHNSYSIEQLIALGEYLLVMIRKLQAPARTDTMNNEWKKLVDKIESKKINKLDKQIISIIKFLLDEIQLIKLDIVAFHILNDQLV